MTPQSPRIPKTRGVGAVLLVALLLAALLPATALAANAVTPISGGSAISADTNSVNGTGAWTTLSGPELNGTSGTLDAGSETWTIDDAAEFAFNPGIGSASLTGAGCGTLAVSAGPTVVAASVSITLTGDSSGTCNVVISGLQARPTAAGAAPLETSTITASGIVAGAAGSLTVVPGAGTLQFTQGTIGNAAADVDLSPQPVVHTEDQYGNARTGDSVAISIKPGTGTPGATVTCTTNPVVTNGSGNATFAGCDIDVAGAGYRLLAAAAGNTSGESNLFNITAGAASKLFYLTQPSRGVPNIPFGGQPVVEIEDSLGNRVTTDSTTTVTLAITTNPGGGTLTCSGGLTRTAASGVATFSGCSINNAGVGYRITASSSPVLTTAVSNLFDVADRLVFTTEPSASTSAGVVFASQPVVAVRAGASATAVNDQATLVTLSLKPGTGASGATLTCDSGLTRTVANGVAAYTGCRIDRISPTSPSNPYKILATATNLTTAESANVAITAGAASKLGFTAQPTSGVATQAFPIQPVVAVQDAGGNTVTSGTNSAATVTLSLGAGAPAGSILTCTGGLAKAAVAGVASFSGCSINIAGTYTLVATASNLAAATTVTSATSSPFVVTAPVAAITLTNSASVITWGNPVTLSIQFGANGANKTFVLEGARDGVTWVAIATLTTNASGFASLPSYTPPTNLYYRARFAGTGDLGAANSNTTRTVVRQIALLRPTNSGATKSIARNSSIKFTTTVRPARPELAPAKVSFVLYKLVGSGWNLVSTRNVFIDAAGLASTTFKFTSAGRYYVRTIANPTPYNANSVWSPLERYTVR
jgi:hypothetical protein